MLELWVQGNTGSVAALATIQIAITAAFVGIAGLLMKEAQRMPDVIVSGPAQGVRGRHRPSCTTSTFTIKDGEFFTLLGPQWLRQVHDPERASRAWSVPTDGTIAVGRRSPSSTADRKVFLTPRSATSAWSSRATRSGRT